MTGYRTVRVEGPYAVPTFVASSDPSAFVPYCVVDGSFDCEHVRDQGDEDA